MSHLWPVKVLISLVCIILRWLINQLQLSWSVSMSLSESVLILPSISGSTWMTDQCDATNRKNLKRNADKF